MLTLSPFPPWIWASVVWAGHVKYMAFTLGRLTGWHRFCSVPVGLTEWLWWEESAAFWLQECWHLHTAPHMHSHTFHLICLLFPSFTSFRFLTCRCARPLLATHLCSVWTCRLESQILAPPPSCFSLSSSFVWPLLTSPPALSLWGLSRWAAVCSSTYLSSSYPSSKLIKKCLRSPLTSLCPPTADLLKLVNWSPFILIIVWIFHVCDLWIKHRI